MSARRQQHPPATGTVVPVAETDHAPLSGDEQQALARAEVTIERGLRSFIEVGDALAQVRDHRLYRDAFPTFEAYCRDRWGITDRRARQLIDATETVQALPTGTTVPVSERQARELRGLDPDAAAAVMAAADDDTSGHVTADAIAKARAALGRQDRGAVPSPAADRPPATQTPQAGTHPADNPTGAATGSPPNRHEPSSETGRGEVGPGGGPRPGRTTTENAPSSTSSVPPNGTSARRQSYDVREPVQSPGPLVRAVRRAVDDLAAAPAQDLEQLEPWHRKEARAALEQLAAVLDKVDPQIDPDLDAAADDIAARTHVDEDEARWIARAVRDRNKPGSLLNYVRRIDPADLLARYRPERRQSAAAMPPCEHGISGGLRVIGRGAQASRHCLQCETADPAVREEATP